MENKYIEKEKTEKTVKSKEIKIDKIIWAKVRENAKLPTKRIEDAGYDVYICPDKKEYILHPGDIQLFPTGIASAFPEGNIAIIKERGSTGSKGMSVRMGIVDSGYRNEWVIGINNTSSNKIAITSDLSHWENRNHFHHTRYTVYDINKAMAQVIFVPEAILESADQFITFDKLKEMKSERGTGKLGSTGK